MQNPLDRPNGARYPALHPGGSVRLEHSNGAPDHALQIGGRGLRPQHVEGIDAPYRCAWAHANGRASFARAESSQRRDSWLEWEV